jgi:hypothetical protein
LKRTVEATDTNLFSFKAEECIDNIVSWWFCDLLSFSL